MKKYPKYKDSGVQWIGQVPENWSVSKFKYTTQLFTGNSLNDSQKEKYTQEIDSSYPYVATKDVTHGNECANYSNGIYIPIGTKGFKIAPKDSFLLCIEGGSAGKKMTYLDRDVCFVNKLCCFVSHINSRYQYYYIQSSLFNSMFRQSMQGLIGGVSISEIQKLPIPLPPLSEQQAIANYLDEQTAKIDKSINLLELQKADLQAYHKALIGKAVTKGLNPNAKLKDSGIQWIGQIPEEWSVSKLKYAGEARNGLTYSPDDICDAGTLVLRSSNIQDSRLDFNDNVYVGSAPDTLKMQQGDILICSRNGSIALVGKCAYIPNDMDAVFGAFMMRFRPKCANRFMFYVVQEAIQSYKAYYATSTVNQLTVDVFGNMQIPLPSRIEQEAIANYLDKKTSDIDTAIERINAQITELQAYRTALISEAVTGKIDVRP